MLHYETKLRLHEAKKETDSIGIITKEFDYYKYGYVVIGNGTYETNEVTSVFNRKEILVISYFVNKVAALVNVSRKREWDSVDSGIEHILVCHQVLKEGRGEFTDSQNIVEILEHLEKEKLDYIIFKEGGVWQEG